MDILLPREDNQGQRARLSVSVSPQEKRLDERSDAMQGEFER
jgi:hypothetical protein